MSSPHSTLYIVFSPNLVYIMTYSYRLVDQLIIPPIKYMIITEFPLHFVHGL